MAKINPATGRPRSMDKKLGADAAGMARRKAEMERSAAQTRRYLAAQVAKRKGK